MNWDTETLTYIAQIHELKGKQEIFENQKTADLDKLIEIAKIQSTAASNIIEGIMTTTARLKQLFKEKTSPKNRAEEEIAGYRDALNLIHENYEYIDITPNYILQLHKILYSHESSAIGGHFKNVQNYITASSESGTYTVFTPLAPYETAEAIKKICEEFNLAIAESEIDPLILIPIFIHDFLCIHPFLDGNGRMSRLLTTLLLYKSRYYVGKFISLEAIIAKNKELYYNALEQSQNDWHKGKDNPLPFIKYFLGVVISAYRELDDRISIISNKKVSIKIVENIIENIIGIFNKQEIIKLSPNLSVSAIEKALAELVRQGKILKHGRGKSTFYIKTKK